MTRQATVGAPRACGASAGRRHPRRRGFGLLEAVVALTILAATGMALFDWLQQSLRSAARSQDDLDAARMKLLAIAYVETLNPAAMPQGEVRLGDDGLLLRWTSEPMTPPERNTMFGGQGPGVWEVGLHRMRVQVRRGEREVAFEQWRPGTRRVDAAPPASP